VQSITLQNEIGQTIEVKRGEKAGEIDIRHTRIHPTIFGRYYEVAERARHPPIASFLSKFDIDLRDMKTEEGGAYATINGKLCLLDMAEVASIREAINKLE
jgi:hypothetical protein